MNNEKQIAQTIIDAQKMREESYHIPAGDGSGIGDYRLDIEECLKVAGELNDLSSNMWYLLSLACHWMNDVQLWAEDILAGKNIEDEVLTDTAREKLLRHSDEIDDLKAEITELEENT